MKSVQGIFADVSHPSPIWNWQLWEEQVHFLDEQNNRVPIAGPSHFLYSCEWSLAFVLVDLAKKGLQSISFVKGTLLNTSMLALLLALSSSSQCTSLRWQWGELDLLALSGKRNYIICIPSLNRRTVYISKHCLKMDWRFFVYLKRPTYHMLEATWAV